MISKGMKNFFKNLKYDIVLHKTPKGGDEFITDFIGIESPVAGVDPDVDELKEEFEKILMLVENAKKVKEYCEKSIKFQNNFPQSLSNILKNTRVELNILKILEGEE